MLDRQKRTMKYGKTYDFQDRKEYYCPPTTVVTV